MSLFSRAAVMRLAVLMVAMFAFGGIGAAQISQPPPGGGAGIAVTPPTDGGSGISRPPPGGGGTTPGGGGGVTPPPPPPPPADLAIFIAVNGQTTGPFDTAALKAKVASGELRGETLVWKQGMTAWAPASTLPELVAMLGQGGGGGGGGGTESATAFLAGTWGYTNVSVPMDGTAQGILNGQVTYTPNGQMSFQGTMNVSMQGQTQQFTITGQGTYTAQRLDANRIQVSSQSNMTFSNPMMGTNTQASSEVTVLTIQDRNTVIDSEGNRSTRIR